MRFRILLLVIICTAAQSGFSQIGMQIGWNTTGYKYMLAGTKLDRGYKWGLNTGLVYRSPGKKICVQPELLYTQKGAINNNNDKYYVPNVLEYRNKLNYIEIAVPLLFKVPFAGPKNTFDLGAGPYFAKMLSADSKIMYLYDSTRTVPFRLGSDSTADFKQMDIGLVLYTGFRFRHVFMSICYEIGVCDIAPAKNLVIKNGCFNINFGILF